MTPEEKLDNLYYIVKGILKAYRDDVGCQGHDECRFDGCAMADAIEDQLDKLKNKKETDEG
jgi:hypothetical protein